MNQHLLSCLIILVSSFEPSEVVPLTDKLLLQSFLTSLSPDEINDSNQIAIRKLQELNRETVDQVLDMIPEFLNRTMEKAKEQTGCINWYAAMQGVVYRNNSYLAIGGSPLTDFTTTMRRVTDAKVFFENVVHKNWENGTGTFESWVLNVTNGDPIPGKMMDGSDDVIVSFPFSWWSPDDRLDMPTSSSLDKGNQDFLEVCEILSLAPEWYPNGLISIEYMPDQPHDVFVRPSTYNGLTSPLWVQHPDNVSAETGDKARETISLVELSLKEIVTRTTDKGEIVPYVRLYPVTPNMTGTLGQSPSVFEYSVNVEKVSPNKMLGDQQRKIAEDVEREREALAPEFPWKKMEQDIQALIDIIKAQPPCSVSTACYYSMYLYILSLTTLRALI